VRFSVQEDVFADVAGLRLAVGWLEIPRAPTKAEALSRIGPAWEAAAGVRAEPLASHPMLAPWRDVFRRLGLPARDYLPSVEALLRRARRGGPPLQVLPLVDAYNAISLRWLVPVGAFDLTGLAGDILLGRTRGGEAFWPIDAQGAEQVAAGELCYLDGERVLTRHFVWRQSIWGMIRPETRRLFLVSELLPMAHALAQDVLADFASIAQELGGRAELDLLDQEHRASEGL